MPTDYPTETSTEWKATIADLTAAVENSPNPFFKSAVSRLETLHQKCITVTHATDLLHALAEALRTCITTKQIETALVQLLPDVLRISRSRFGFLAEVCYNAADKPYLKSHAVTDIFKPNFGPHDIVSGLAFHNLETLNGAIMTSKRPVLANTPEHDPRSGGVSFGHAQLTAFLGLPFLLESQLVGAVALANRPDGYSETEVELLTPLCEIGGLMIAAYRQE